MLCTLLTLALLAACSGEPPPLQRDPENCVNGSDDDLDGRVDCDDSDCWAACAENCTDGQDNDGDGLVDCEDPACDGQCGEICDDGRDNDLDGITDCEDSDCIGQCPEQCGNGIDDDDDGSVDCDDPDCDTTCDSDEDGYIDAGLGGDDCNDTDPDIHPGADETCNGIDDDCDGDLDDDDNDIIDASDWYVDDDQDGYGSESQRLVRCDQPVGTIGLGGDCDDYNEDINPLGMEVCNGEDDDCNGLTDDEDPGLDLDSLIAWYTDGDSDGWGVPSTPILQCANPGGRADNPDDCDDTNPTVLGSEPWLWDNDGDGYGAGTPSAPSCTTPGANYERQSAGEDCDDNAPSVYPGAADICLDGIDQDCDGADFTGCTDTAALLTIYGDAEVDPVAGTYLGSETNFMEGLSGTMVCEWSWTTTDWAHDPTAVGPDPFTASCIDFDGNPCLWNYTVHFSAGAMQSGYDCAFYGLTPAAATLWGPVGFGWIDSYNALGINYGPSMMYHNPYNPTIPAGLWISIDLNSVTPTFNSYNSVSDEFLYDWPDAGLLAVP